MALYRKKQVQVEAVQLTQRNGAEVGEWCGGNSYDVGMAPGLTHHVDVPTPDMDAATRATPGYYVLQEACGCFNVLDAATFEATYEPVDRSEQPATEEDLDDVRADVITVFEPNPIEPGGECAFAGCEAKAPAHYCRPREDAKRRLLEFAGRTHGFEQPATSDQEEGENFDADRAAARLGEAEHDRYEAEAKLLGLSEQGAAPLVAAESVLEEADLGLEPEDRNALATQVLNAAINGARNQSAPERGPSLLDQEGGDWPVVVLSRPSPEADPENYEVWQRDNPPTEYEAETRRYVPAPDPSVDVEEGLVGQLRDAVLILLASGFHTSDLEKLQDEHPAIDDAVQSLFDRKLIKNRRDPCDEYETLPTDAGEALVKAALLAATPDVEERSR